MLRQSLSRYARWRLWLAKITTRLVAIIEAFLPAHCLNCNQACGEASWLCADCRSTLVRNENPCPDCAMPHSATNCRHCKQRHFPFHSAEAPLIYDGLARELIHHWKFEGAPELTPALIEIAGSPRQLVRGIDVIVPIPMAFGRRWSRGYNQSTLLARALMQQLHKQTGASIPLVRGLTIRGSQKIQHRLSRADRRVNANHRFRAIRNFTGKRILLVDDVMTTGATLAASTRALLEAGAVEVHVWCLARAP